MVGMKSMGSVQMPPAFSMLVVKQSVVCGGASGKSVGYEIALKSSAAFPMFSTETVCGLSLLVLSTLAAAKLKDGVCERLISTTWVPFLSGKKTSPFASTATP